MTENIVKISQIIGGRYDFAINFYKQSTSKFKFPTRKIGDLLLTNPQYGANESGIERKSFTEPRYIRITDINEFGELDSSIGVTAAKIEDKYILNENDIIIARSGATVGKSYIYKQNNNNYICFFAGYMIRFQVNPLLILPDYFFIYTQLNIYKKWISATQRTTGQPNVNAEEYKSLNIPLPPIEIQQKIVDIYDKANQTKQNKEQEAQQLLDSIDSYLLEQLGIADYKAGTKQLGFFVNISELIGKRYDVSFYKDRFELKSTKYNNNKLSDVVIVNPSINFKFLSNEDEISFVPMEVVDEVYGEITENRKTTVSNTKGFTKFEENDLLWAKITPCMQNGKSAIARNLINGVGCGSTEFYVLRPKNEDISIDYIYFLLRHHKVLEATKSSFGGSAGQQRVSSGYLKSVTIPTPPIEIQKEIVNVIISKKTKAQQLQTEASLLLAEAKKEIEKIILG